MKIYRCKKCKNIIESLVGSTDKLCCDEKMELLLSNTVDAAIEKHLPKLVRTGNEVKINIGEITHPMTEEHYIQFVIIREGNKITRYDLVPGDSLEFNTLTENSVEVFSYCNLHGLWMSQI